MSQTKDFQMKKLCLLPFLFYSVLFAQPGNSSDSILEKMKYQAKENLIEKYYPLNTDSVYGGFITSYTYDLKPASNQDKMIVTQARHIWSTAKAAEFYHDSSYVALARHGYKFLKDKMWDNEYGGFYTLVSREGKPKTEMKEAYGNSFAIYALAALYKVSGDTSALNLAKKTFEWLENHSHDPIYKGYFQHLEKNGTPIKRPATHPSQPDLGYKDQNSSIHLLEAFTELYSVWPDPMVKERLNELLILIRDTIVTTKGYLQLFFTPDWKPVTFRDSTKAAILANRNLDHVSFGHDVETAYLMMEASEALGIHDDKRTMEIAKKMVDHALQNGWDKQPGGFYDEGYYFKNTKGITIIRDSKNWWAQAEGLNTLLIFSDLYPNDKWRYFDFFKKQWNYIETYLVDHQYGDWYEYGTDKVPDARTRLKTHIWKATYHHFRALTNCIKRLERKNK